MPTIRGRSSTRKAKPGSKLCSRSLISFASAGLRCGLPRIATSPRVFERPLSTTEAEAAISSWLAQRGRGDSRSGRTALGHPVRSCARRTGCRPAGHGRRPRRDRAGAWRHALHVRSRLLAVFRAQVDEPSRREPLTERAITSLLTRTYREPTWQASLTRSSADAGSRYRSAFAVLLFPAFRKRSPGISTAWS